MAECDCPRGASGKGTSINHASLVSLFQEFRDRKDADRILSHAQTVHLPYKEWAENHIAYIKGVLDGERAEHTQAVKDHIGEVGQMKDVVLPTKRHFKISKVRTPPFLLTNHRSCIAAATRPFGYRRLHSLRLIHLRGVVLKPGPFI
jgi:hypothetical protein